MTQPAAIADFKSKFDRDFPFGPGKESVRDSDIQNAFDMADTDFNVAIWISTAESKLAYLYLAAHILALNIQNAGGLDGGAGGGVDSASGGIIQSKSVGQVSVNYNVQDALNNDPILGPFMRTGYGQQYVQMARPRIVGGGYVVAGWCDVV